jgi:hypothetical protein
MIFTVSIFNMEPLTQHPLFQILKGTTATAASSNGAVAAGMDIKQMFANIPSFLSALQRAKL